MERHIAVAEILAEHERATKSFPTFNSAHEGISVIREEFDELWFEVKRKTKDDDLTHQEAVQLGAMVLRFLCEIC